MAALASKWFRIPVAVDVTLAATRPDRRTLVGFGDPACTRERELAFYGVSPTPGELEEVARNLRLRGWVALEAADCAEVWPSERDIAALQAEVRGEGESWTWS